MPELPEVETVRRTLSEAVVGQMVTHVDCFREDVVRGEAATLAGQRIAVVLRHGKQLAIVGDRGAAVCIHLGMSGTLRAIREGEPGLPGLSELPGGDPDLRSRTRSGPASGDHVHVVWRLEGGGAVAFRDPRRFGGVWAFDHLDKLRAARWAALGDDALTITPGGLHKGLRGTKRAVKAALLDQAVVAGLGNIYVDELLHAVGMHPCRAGATVGAAEARGLVRAMRPLLSRAIAAGGTTLRDYRDAAGGRGRFEAHRVYGRGGQPCHTCAAALKSTIVAGRTTTFCGACQAG